MEAMTWARDISGSKLCGLCATVWPIARPSGMPGECPCTGSGEFQVPGSPDPHWQVVDSKGTVYLLDRVKLKDDKINTSITVPSYVPDIAKVQMWCAWAEVVLGEAPFAASVVASK